MTYHETDESSTSQRLIPPPVDWDEYVGQQHLKQVLNTHCEGALAMGRRWIAPVMLDGPPGCGKTVVGQLVADKLGVEFEVMAMTDFRPDRMRDIVRRHEGVVLLDELHAASRKDQESLLTLLEEGYYQYRGYKSHAHPEMTWIAATTDIQDVRPALRERFKIRPGYDKYSLDDMTDIATNMLVKSGMRWDPEFARAIAPAAAGIPRRLEKIVIMKRDLWVTEQDDSPEAVLNMLRLTMDGLGEAEVQYMKFLETRGIAGKSVLMTALRMDKVQIDEVERTLVDRGWIEHMPSGRALTRDGDRRAKELTSV